MNTQTRYACLLCNAYKSEKWPTPQQLAEGLRFLDPCSEDIHLQYRFDGDGHVDLVCKVEGRNVASQIFDISSLPAREQNLLPATAFEDVADARIAIQAARELGHKAE